MSKLSELIQELCPNGVEYKAIEAVTTMHRGVRVVRRDLEPDGLYPVYQNSLIPLGYMEEKNCDAGTTFVISAGAAGEVGFSSIDFWAADDCYYFDNNEFLDGCYLYHVLLSKQHYLFSQVRKASIPRLGRNIIDKMIIPVPPLEVQQEIVRILDSFTLLTSELTSQLTSELIARKKQYEFYRNKLLSYDNTIQMEKLGFTCEMKAGKAISGYLIFEEKSKDTPIKCYGGNGIRGYVKEPNEEGCFPIIGRQGALCGNVNYSEGQFYATEHAIVVKSKGKYDSRFLYHLLVHMNLNQYKSAGAQPGLAVKNIAEIKAPVPTMEQQKKIVNILDNFETICNDLNIGLPAEIEARKKQYEYYRDVLLTFAECGEIIFNDTTRHDTTRHDTI